MSLGHPSKTTGHPQTTRLDTSTLNGNQQEGQRSTRATKSRYLGQWISGISIDCLLTTCNCGTWTVVPFGTTLTTALEPSTERDPTSIGYPPSDPRYAVSPSRTEPQASPATCIRTPVAWLIVAVQTTKRSDQRTIQSHSKCRGLKSPLRLTPNGVAPSKGPTRTKTSRLSNIQPVIFTSEIRGTHVSATGQRVSSDNRFRHGVWLDILVEHRRWGHIGL